MTETYNIWKKKIGSTGMEQKMKMKSKQVKSNYEILIIQEVVCLALEKEELLSDSKHLKSNLWEEEKIGRITWLQFTLHLQHGLQILRN